MADNIVQGLFGITPESYQLQQEQAAREQALQFAGMNPFQRAAYGTFLGANQLGGAIGGALGAQDPQLQMVARTQNLIKSINPSDEKSLAAGIQEATQFNPQLALGLSQTLQNLQKNRADISKSLRETMPPEQKLAQALADNQFERGSADWNRTYGSELKRLTTKETTDKSEIKEVGVAEGTREPVYTYKTSASAVPQQIVFKTDAQGNQTIVPYTGGVDRTTAKTNLNVKLPEGEAEFVKRLGVKDAERVDAAITARETASTAIRSLNKLATLPADQLISGQFATGRVGATNLLTTLGLASPEDAARLATSQQYQKVAGDVILSTLGGRLGSGFSNADRDFIASLVPQLETNPEARRELIKYMQNKNQEIIDDSVRLENYARDNRGLKGFNYKIPFSAEPSKVNPYAKLSDSELAARIQALQAAQPK